MNKLSSESLLTINQLGVNTLLEIKKNANYILYREENEFKDISKDTIFGLKVYLEGLERQIKTLSRVEKQAVIEYRRINKLDDERKEAK